MAEDNVFVTQIKFKADTKELDNAKSKVKETDEGVKKTEKSVERLGKTGESALRKFADASSVAFNSVMLLKTGLDAVLGVANQLKGFSLENMAAYETQLRAETQLGVTLKNQGYDKGAMGRLKGLASDMQKNTMYGDEAFLGGFGELSTYFKDENALKQMAPLLADYAAGMTGGGQVGYQQMIDLATGLGKAIDGTYDSLRKKGFDTSELEALTAIQKSYQGMQGAKSQKDFEKNRANLKALEKEYGEAAKSIIASNGEIDESLKVQALGRALDSWKGLAEEMAKTPMGQLQQIKNEIGDMREKLGEDMYLALAPALNVLKSNMPKIEAFLQSIGNIATQGVAFLTEHQDDMLDILDTITEALKTIANNIDKLWSIFKVAFGIASVIAIKRMSVAVKDLAVNLGLASSKSGLAAGSFASLANRVGVANAAVLKLNHSLRQNISLSNKAIAAAGGAIIGATADEGDLQSAGGSLKGFASAVGAGAVAGGGIGAVIGGAGYLGATLTRGIYGVVKESGNEKERATKKAKQDAAYEELVAARDKFKKEGGISFWAYKNAAERYESQGGALNGFMVKELGRTSPESDASKNTKGSVTNNVINSNNSINQNNTIGAEFSELGKLLRQNLRDILERDIRLDAISTEAVAVI